MKKAVLIITLLVLGLHLVAAQAIEVAPQDVVPVVVATSDAPVHFTLHVTNTGKTDDFDLYSYVGVRLDPAKVHIAAGNTTTVEVDAYVSKEVRKNTHGFFIFEYELYSPLNKISKNKLMVKIVNVQDMLEIRALNILPGEDIALISLRNLENVPLKDVELQFSSPFLDTKKTVSFAPYELVNVSVPIATEKSRSILAGTYPLEVKISYQGSSGTQHLEQKYLEKGGLSVSEHTTGIIVQHTVANKTNEGNVPVTAFITQKKNIFTRLLTSFEPRPTNVTKQGFYVQYTWEKEIAPATSLIVTSTTNYTLPFAILIIIIVLVILVKVYTLTNLSLTKHVSHVRTRGGEFALKITLHAKARKHIENITLTDRIPHSMQLYEKFGIRPDTVDEASRRVVWKIPRLNAGEGRVFSYVIYSKIRVVGNFELPLAHATYTKDAKPHTLYSNKTSFISDTFKEE